MQYQSTRSPQETAGSAEAILRGIAPDGGLYIAHPDGLCPNWQDLLRMDFYGMAETLLGRLLPDFGPVAMHKMVHAAYEGKFNAADVVPLREMGNAHILELFHGPTSAFKDVALSILPQFITEARKLSGQSEETLILTATSGDTGKAALEGFRDVPGTRIAVFYPRDGVSAIQKKQMATQAGNNVAVCAVEGNFDDAQTGVKKIFAACESDSLLDGTNMVLSSANSINIGRLAPQTVYYFKAYADLVKDKKIRIGDPVDFVVPTGNFGNILAGYLAKRMGLPVGRLVCASNANDVLTEFLHTGRYDRRRHFYKTLSPSMDILVSSNLERLLWLMSDGDSELVSEKMRELSEKGWYQVSPELLAEIQAVFLSGCCDDAETKGSIRNVWEKERYLCDPHTAVAWGVRGKVKADLTGKACVVLSTASPYKFAPAVLEALGENVSEDEFDCMESLNKFTGVAVPANLLGLRALPILHKDCVPKDEMLRYVLRKAGESQWNK